MHLMFQQKPTDPNKNKRPTTMPSRRVQRHAADGSVLYGLPTTHQIKIMVQDCHGVEVTAGAMAVTVEPVPSSAETGDVPVGSIVQVQKRSGAGWYVVDTRGELHIAPSLALEVLPERETTEG